jgi:hypothetical protein
MSKTEQDYTLLFHSAADIPPPHAFHALIRISGDKKMAEIEFRREYTDREDLPADEIEAEGFGPDDDFSWKGNLPGFWLEETQKMVESSEWKSAGNTQLLLSEPGTENWLSPLQEKKWVRFAEELIQACLEEGGKELPMEMAFGELMKNNFFESLSLEWRFARREIHAAVKGGTQAAFSGRDWDDAEEQLKIWMEEESSGKDLYQLPKFKGKYWLVNGDIWLPERQKLRGRVWEWVYTHLAASGN